VRLEQQRMATVQAGYHSRPKSPLESLAYVSLQELATRISHRNTGRFVAEPVADRLLARIAADENLHMVFYRLLVDASLEIDVSATVSAICRQVRTFDMPGTTIPGFAAKARVIARAGIYDLRIHHDEVVWPLLRHWRLLDRTGLDPAAEQARDEMVAFLDTVNTAARRQRDRFSTIAARNRSRAGQPVPTGS
jgi:acyl-[acyl-carrier-protein] desaturase